MPASLLQSTKEIASVFSNQITKIWLLVDIESQRLYLLKNQSLLKEFIVSTSRFGIGSQLDSYKTPVGAHQIAECIGDGCELFEIFEGREATGKIADIVVEKKSSELDLILTRILRLRGLEANKNCGDGVDSYDRYIYIHGTHEEGLLGIPASHGCIRMANTDVKELFEQVTEGVFVYITY